MGIRTRLILVVLFVMAVVVPAKAQNVIYHGRGNGLEVNVLSLVGVNAADTGFLAPSGGTLSANVASANLVSGLTTVANTGVISTQTVGSAGAVNSFAQVNGLRILQGLTPALDLVNATTVRSDASGVLGSAGGSSTIENLMVLGTPITVTGAPNQTVSVPGVLNLTINRQTTTNGVLRVDALYLDILSVANTGTISVATSYAGVTPAPEPSSFCLLGLAVPGAMAIIRRRRSC